MKNALEVRNICKRYKDFQLKDVSFSLPPSSITGLIGINGAGKTTTIRLILNLIHADAGAVTVCGYNMQHEEEAAKECMGVVLDDGGLYGNLTLRENKGIIASAYESWDDQQYKQLIRRFKLQENQKSAALSRGMRIKASLILAMSHHAKLLIMDEPTGGLDPLVREQLLMMLQEYVDREKASVLFSTHITTDLDKVADRIIFLHQGRVIMDDFKDTIIRSHVVLSGPKEKLSAINKKAFISIEISGNVFHAVARREDLNRQLQSIVTKTPVMEDIMLAYISGGSYE